MNTNKRSRLSRAPSHTLTRTHRFEMPRGPLITTSERSLAALVCTLCFVKRGLYSIKNLPNPIKISLYAIIRSLCCRTGSESHHLSAPSPHWCVQHSIHIYYMYTGIYSMCALLCTAPGSDDRVQGSFERIWVFFDRVQGSFERVWVFFDRGRDSFDRNYIKRALFSSKKTQSLPKEPCPHH